MTKKYCGLFTACMAGLLCLALAGSGRGEVVDRIVAEVNDEIITMSELQAMAKAMEAQTGTKPSKKEDREIQRKMLEAMIDRKLALAEAKKRGINVSDKDVNLALERFKKNNNIPDDATLARGLAQEGIGIKELRQTIADQITQERLAMATVKDKVSVTEADIRRFYESQVKKGGSGGQQVHLRSVKVPFPAGATEAQKDELKKMVEGFLKEVKQGASFPAVAKKHSLDETDMGFVALADLDPRLAEHLARMQTSDVAPIQTPQGYQLLQLVARRTGPVEAVSYEEAAPKIRTLLMQQAIEQQFADWIKTQRAKAHIKMML